MGNIINKECPKCGHPESEIQYALTLREKEGRVTYNIYRCLRGGSNKNIGKHAFRVKRKGDKEEQALTEKYISSEHMV